MNIKPFRKVPSRGFALVATLSLMILLTILAVGLLSLSSISLRSSADGEASARANANARLAVMMAIGELQKQVGDDRRITADASITAAASQPHLVGSWKSWSPNFAASPGQTAPNYGTIKAGKFQSWLVSAPDPAILKDGKWPESKVGSDWVRLFSLAHDGFNLSAPPVPMPLGSLAWVVSQENTKAKVNIAGPEKDKTLANVDLQAQARPSLALSSSLKEPAADWNLRASRLLSLNQIKLDKDLNSGTTTAPSAGASYTVHAQGLLTDVVKGGLKTDLSLGFELSDSEFAKTTWSDTPNPFRSPNSSAGFSAPPSYKLQQPLFRPLLEKPIISITTDFSPASVANRFYAAGVPTFDHLRSFYRIPHHLYGSSSTPVVAERGADHAAIKLPDSAPASAYWSPGNPPKGSSSTLSIRPVLNRMLYLLSFGLGSDDKVRLIITPVISLWNPYNVDLEIDGAVAYPWIDMPFKIVWKINGAETTVQMSRLMGKQFASQNEGRSIDPYFFCELTSDGDKNNANNKPIRLKPGEVRVFVPASPTPVEFDRLGSNYARTVQMRPVDTLGQMNKKGGLSVAMNGYLSATGFDKVVKKGQTVSCEVRGLDSRFHYFVSLEDAARIKTPADSTHGESIADVQVLNFVSATDKVTSELRTYDELKTSTTPFPFGVLETFQRVAKQGTGGQAVADLVYTTNPRHAAINHQLANGSFLVAPHYQSTLRLVSTFDEAIQTTTDGRDSFWGASQSSAGEAHLPFFEIPREPLISLAGFQHADLASSTYSSSNQFGNSWASPYLARNKAGVLAVKSTSSGSAYPLPVYDQPYLSNEALWDAYFFSSAAPRLQPASSGNPVDAWQAPIAKVERSLEKVLEDFVADPQENPLINSRMRLVNGGYGKKELVQRLLDPAGCTRIAAHLMVDGAFNINSTDVEAWVAVLAGLRGKSFEVAGTTATSSSDTPFPRFRHPTGEKEDNWNGYRSLSDDQIRTLADTIVQQVRLRGPFLSLAEFINRRVESGDLGSSGAIQASIDIARFNDSAKQAPFSSNLYPLDSRSNIILDTGVGIPGYLTQADVLQSLAPVITARSDTFTVRGYGEAKDKSGKVIARAWCEAVVQRVPEFVDPTNSPDTKIASASAVNQTFGRRFAIISFRRISPSELQ